MTSVNPRMYLPNFVESQTEEKPTSFNRFSIYKNEINKVRAVFNPGIYACLRPVTVLSKLLAILPLQNVTNKNPSSLRFSFCSCIMFYNIFCLLLFLLYAISTTYFSKKHLKSSNEEMNSSVLELMSLMMFGQTLMTSLFAQWKTKHYPLHFAQWEALAKEIGIRSKKQFWLQDLLVQILLNLPIMLISAVSFVMQQKENLNSILPNINIYFLCFCLIFLSLYVKLIQHLPSILCIYYLRIANEGFLELRRELRKLLQLPTSLISPQKMMKLRTKHEKICFLARDLNDIFAYYILVFFIASTFYLCCFLYLEFAEDTTLPSSVWGITAFFVFLHMFRIISVFDQTQKAGYLASTLFEAKLLFLKQETQMQIQLFLSKLSGSPLEFTVFGFFTLRKAALTAILSTVFNYCVILIQFRGNNSTSMSSINNATCLEKH